MLARIYNAHGALTLLILCISAAGFFYGSYNIFFLLQANLGFLIEHGADAVEEGALMQLLEITGSIFLAALSYTSIKICERVLVDKAL